MFKICHIEVMSSHIPSKKFPYIVLQNGSGDAVDELCSHGNKEYEPKDEDRRLTPSTSRPGSAGHGVEYPMPPLPSTFRPSMSHYQNGAVPFNMSKMKAVLTAQNELRKPASSLYPSASTMSLIPETEEIYRKYFPNDEFNTTVPITYGSNKPKPLRITPSNDVSVRCRRELLAALSTSSSDASVSQRNEIIQQRSVTTTVPPVDTGIALTGTDTMTAESEVSSANEKLTSGRHNKDCEIKFKKRVQSQFLSLSTEIERQSSELSELKKELKDLRQTTRKSSTEQDGAKSRIETLSKHVQEIDSKVDTLQESLNSQEKNLLSKLMLIGDISDSDSDESTTAKMFFDPIRSTSATKLPGLSAKRPVSATSNGNSNSATSTLINDTFPKVCSNWIPIAPDFDKFMYAVALLNYRMDRNQSMKLTSTNNGATFKHSDVIDLTLYKNGMSLGSAGFRSYSTMSVIKFVNEIFNGYLPTELSTQYPDGVVIVLSDKRSLNHASSGFNGTGMKLLKKEDTDIPDLMPGDRDKWVKMKAASARSARLSTTSFSQASVSISSTLSLAADCDTLPDLIKERDERLPKAKVIRLKIHEAKNGKKYKLNVSVNTTIKELSDHMKRCMDEKEDLVTNILLSNGLDGAAAASSKTYDIILPVPHGKLACLSSTLEDYGITQNTLLCIQAQDQDRKRS